MSWTVLRPLVALTITLPAHLLAQVPDCGLYTYKADIIRVIDGDTVVANIDLGFNTWLHDERLLRIPGYPAGHSDV